ncbi:hypothetical protein SVI_2176 [Shewanella violacea DSS12]|uniref:Uncharacterized protein n=1 Tax=Shewanella violacea (strain JCM 10179 / CIP 106290 / LMG 19151 / DSS12) TaxID=637905 RepID=D4ZKE8_SHEVD|nr:hypothetical protein SVI_2176 [Shewanella violacea DSS12]
MYLYDPIPKTPFIHLLIIMCPLLLQHSSSIKSEFSVSFRIGSWRDYSSLMTINDKGLVITNPRSY